MNKLLVILSLLIAGTAQAQYTPGRFCWSGDVGGYWRCDKDYDRDNVPPGPTVYRPPQPQGPDKQTGCGRLAGC